MKHPATILSLLLSCSLCKAQLFKELFKQDQTQKEYLIKQIAAFHTYLGHVKKGYSIAKTGLTTIRNIKNSDLEAHRKFFAALKDVNPRISSYYIIPEIILLQFEILNTYKRINNEVQRSKIFSTTEKKYIDDVFSNLMNRCASNIEELNVVTTSGKLEMKDDERIAKIKAIYNSVQDQFTFTQSFEAEVKILGIQRKKEQHDIQTRQTLSGIKEK